MSLNFTGIAIDKNFDKDPEKLIRFLGLPLVFESEIDFDSGSGAKEDDYFDVFFSDIGTLVYAPQFMQPDSEKSHSCTIFTFMVSEIAMCAYFGLDKNGRRVREITEQEDGSQEQLGEKLNIETYTADLTALIIKQKEQLFGHNFYRMPTGTKGSRLKLAKVSKEDVYKAPFYDSSSMASNPGRIRVNYFQWAKMNITAVAKKSLFLIASILLMTKVHWLFGIVLLAALLYNFWYWVGVKTKFRAGDVNPGKVISLNPDRIAVSSNLTKFAGNYPILRIIEAKLPKHERQLGMFIPTVAIYHNNPYDYPFWAEFHPVPISHGTTDRGILKNRFETFTKADFERLDKYIKQVPTIEPGTYKVDKDTSGWKSYPDVVIGDIYKMKAPEKKEEKG